jgi:hypothetical protein
MFLVVCEGALRKWAFMGFQAQVYLIKDGLLILAYLGFLVSRRPSRLHLNAMTGLKILLTLSLVYFGIQLFNPNSPSILLSLVGFKNYLLYVPLVFVLPYMFSSSADLEAKLQKYAMLMIPFAGLGLVQFAFPYDHWINGYLSQDTENLRAAAMFGDLTIGAPKARTTGTFSYIGGYTTFLSAMTWLGVGLVASKNWRLRGNVRALLLLVTSLAATFTTGSRAPVFALIIASPLALFVLGSGGLISMRNVLRFCVVWAILAVAISLIASDAIDAYEHRVQQAGDSFARILLPITEAFGVLGEVPAIGTGMASTHGSAITIMGTDSYWWLRGVFTENETARIVQETGIIGLLLVFAARFWLQIKAIALGQKFKRPLYVAMSGAIAAFFLQFFFSNVVNNPTAGIYYWFAAGLLFGIYRLARQESAVLGSVSTAKGQGFHRRNVGRPAAPPVAVR